MQGIQPIRTRVVNQKTGENYWKNENFTSGIDDYKQLCQKMEVYLKTRRIDENRRYYDEYQFPLMHKQNIKVTSKIMLFFAKN